MKVVWHVAAMGDWRQVVEEQLGLLRECGLRDVIVTFVGTGLDWFGQTCRSAGVRAYVEQSDPNIMHYETFAMLLIERLAKETDEPILYFHTKGVSNPGDPNKAKWRRCMEEHLVRRWREHVPHLEHHDAIGVNWIDCATPHFSGNYWLARAGWLRQLPDFVAYHHSRQLVRYNCEFWIGSAPGCRPLSLFCRNQPFWTGEWRW
jgi:hypothetical protein